MKLKKVLSAVLAFTTLSLGIVSTVGSVNAVEVETKDTPQPSTSVNISESSADSEVTKNFGLCDNIEDGVILHAWCWDFQTIIDNMDLIARSGYTAIQTSPVTACYQYSDEPSMKIMGDPNDATDYDGSNDCWWWHYQPISFDIGNYQLGTEDKYIEMCSLAEKYNIKIITDVVSNHTARDVSKVDDKLLAAVGITSRPTSVSDKEWFKLYHTNWRSEIADYSDRTQCTTYSLQSLPDINTENPYYQAYLVKFLNKLVADGCDGIRYDTGKHIAAPSETGTRSSYDKEHGYTTNFWEVVNGTDSATGIDGVTVTFNKPDNFFVYGEVLAGDNVPYDEYSNYMRMTADTCGQKLRGYVQNRSFAVVEGNQNGIGAWRLDDSIVEKGIVTWVESHDTYCNRHPSGGLTDWQIRMAWAVIAARKDGTPLFFNRPDGSDGANGDYWGNNKIGKRGNNQFFAPEVVAVNQFRNAMANVGADSETLRNISGYDGSSGEKRVLQIDRYKSNLNSENTCGVCIINLSSNTVDLSGKETNMADGEYLDTVSGNTVIVEGGIFTSGTVKAKTIATIYKTVEIEVNSTTKSFSDRELSVTPIVTNSDIKSGTYKVTDGTTTVEGSFTSDTPFNIGKEFTVSGRYKELELYLDINIGNNNYVTKKFTFIKRNPYDITYAYLKKSNYSAWTETIYAYVYDDSSSTTVENAAWPGEEMTYESDTGYYKYEIPYNLKNGKIVFYSSKTNRYPADGAAGLSLENKSKVLGANQSWTDYNSTQYTIDESEIPDSDSNLDTYKYFYYFDSLGEGSVSVVLDNNNGTTRTGDMVWSDDLKCYYYKYGLSYNYNKVSFYGENISIETQTINPGKVYIPTSNSSGNWQNLDCLTEHKLYFQSSSDWDGVKVHLFKNDTSYQNTNTIGDSMESLGKVLNKDNVYCYTYYVPSIYSYDKVKFFNSKDTTGFTAPTDYSYYDDNPTIYKFSSQNTVCTTETLNFKKDVEIEISYINHKISDMNSDDSFEQEDEKTTSTKASVSSSNISSAMETACKGMKMTNVYDNFTFYGSQFEYVKSIAADIDKRISTTEPRAAYINPENFAKPSTAFSGVYDNSNNFITDLNSTTDENWIKYYSGDVETGYEEVDYKKIKPDSSNISKINVYAYDMQRSYTTMFYYPDSSSEEPNVGFANALYTYTTDKCASKDNSTRYNQLLSSDTTAAIKAMKIPDNKVFDGWYKIEWKTVNNEQKVSSYLKVSSELDYKYRITESSSLYAVFRDESSDPSEPQATAIANSVDVFSETINNVPTTMYRYNTLFNICNCSDNDQSIKQVGVVYVKLGANQDYGNCQDLKDQILTEVKNADFTTTTSKSGTITINNAETPYSYYNYKVGNGNNNTTVKLTAKNRMQFILKLKETQATEGSYQNVLAFTVYKYGSEWNISENCIRYDPTLNDKYETIMITN